MNFGIYSTVFVIIVFKPSSNAINRLTAQSNIVVLRFNKPSTIPRIICITDMKDRIQLKGLKVLYDNTEMNNLDELLRG